MNRFLLLLLLVLPVFVSAQSNLRFLKENIDFTINNDVFTVNGVYTFVNDGDKVLNPQVIFPFSENADSVCVKRVYNINNGNEINFHLGKNSVTFRLVLMEYDTVAFNVYYTQKTNNNNIYILTSTQYWKRPLKNAKYALLVENDITIEGFSYTPDSVSGNKYFWNKSDFFPDEDFKVLIDKTK